MAYAHSRAYIIAGEKAHQRERKQRAAAFACARVFRVRNKKKSIASRLRYASINRCRICTLVHFLVRSLPATARALLAYVCVCMRRIFTYYVYMRVHFMDVCGMVWYGVAWRGVARYSQSSTTAADELWRLVSTAASNIETISRYYTSPRFRSSFFFVNGPTKWVPLSTEFLSLSPPPYPPPPSLSLFPSCCRRRCSRCSSS